MRKKWMKTIFLILILSCFISGCQMQKTEEIPEASGITAVTEITDSEILPEVSTDITHRHCVYSGENENWKFIYDSSAAAYLGKEDGKLVKWMRETDYTYARYKKGLDHLNETETLEIAWTAPGGGLKSNQKGPFIQTDFSHISGKGTSYYVSSREDIFTPYFKLDETVQIQVAVICDGKKETVLLSYDPELSAQPMTVFLGDARTDFSLGDGSWEENGLSYTSCTELIGCIPGTEKEASFTVLSNRDITFEEAWKASGLNAEATEFFDPKDAVIVKMTLP